MITSKKRKNALLVSILTSLLLTAIPANAQLITNGSFEDAFNTENFGAGEIDGWTSSNITRTGKNPEDSPSGGSVFWNNGIVPDGDQVAFLQYAAYGGTSIGPQSLSQTVSGLTMGMQYEISLAYNIRYVSGTAPGGYNKYDGSPVDMSVSIDGGATDLIFVAGIEPVGTVKGDNPFHTVAQTFTAASTSIDLMIAVPSVTLNGGTLLIDNVQLSAVPEPASLALLLSMGGFAVAMFRRRR